MKNLLLITGETSGDIHGGKLVQALLKKDKELKIFAIGGQAIQAAGGELIFNIQSLGVVGLFEVITHLRVIRQAYQATLKTLKSKSIEQVILIDYPDFNLRIAKRAKELGIRVSYYISPQIWAWRAGRIHQIKKRVDQILVILPFEEKIYRDAHVPVEFVGHPLLEEIRPSYPRESLARRFGLNPSSPIFGICPGSRKSELNRLLPVMLQASDLIRAKIPEAQFILPVAPTFSLPEIKARLGNRYRHIFAVQGDASEAMAVCDMLMVASGTATLQAAIIGSPMVIVYKVAALTYWIGKLLLKIKMIGLVNIIAGEKVIPELIQAEATPENIAGNLLKIYDDQEKMGDIRNKLRLIRSKLTDRKASERAAEAVLQLLNR